MALPKKADSDLKDLVDYLQSPSLDTSDGGIGDLFEDRYSFIWKHIKLDETPDMVKFEAFLINVIYHINQVDNAMTNKQIKAASKRKDESLLAFGLLKGYYHTKTDRYGNKSLYNIKERYRGYLKNSDYIKLLYPTKSYINRDSSDWNAIFEKAYNTLEKAVRDNRRYVAAMMTKWMNEEGGCQKYLQEGIDSFTITEDGELKINLQEPSYTLDNFPLGDDSDISKIDEQNQTKNGEIPSPNNEVEEFDIKEDNSAKITLPVNEPKGNNANRNSFDVEENKVPQQIEQEIKNNEKIDKDEICSEGEGVSDISSDGKSASVSSSLNDDNINAKKEKPDAPSEKSSEDTSINGYTEDSEINKLEPPPNLANELYNMFFKLRSDNTYFEAIVEKLDYIPTEIAFSQHRIFCKLYIIRIIQRYCRIQDEAEFLLAMYGLLRGFEEEKCGKIESREIAYYKYSHHLRSNKKIDKDNIHETNIEQHKEILSYLVDRILKELHNENKKLGIVNSIVEDLKNSKVYNLKTDRLSLPEPCCHLNTLQRIIKWGKRNIKNIAIAVTVAVAVAVMIVNLGSYLSLKQTNRILNASRAGGSKQEETHKESWKIRFWLFEIIREVEETWSDSTNSATDDTVSETVDQPGIDDEEDVN